MELQAAVGAQTGLNVQRALVDFLLVHIGLAQDTDIGALEQIVPQKIGQAQALLGDGVDVAQAHPLKIVGVVDLQESGHGLVQLQGKILPAGVAQGGQSDKVAGQIQLPESVLSDEIIVGDGGLLLHLGVGGAQTGDLGGGTLLPGDKLREFVPDGLLELRGLLRADGEDGREAELADHLNEGAALVEAALVLGK